MRNVVELVEIEIRETSKVLMIFETFQILNLFYLIELFSLDELQNSEQELIQDMRKFLGSSSLIKFISGANIFYEFFQTNLKEIQRDFESLSKNFIAEKLKKVCPTSPLTDLLFKKSY